MKFHSTDESCQFRSIAEAERYADKSWAETEQERAALLKTWESYGVYVIDGGVSYSPPKDTSRIKRMCLGCRRREVFGRTRYCDNPKCIRVRRSKSRLLGHSESTTYGGQNGIRLLPYQEAQMWELTVSPQPARADFQTTQVQTAIANSTSWLPPLEPSRRPHLAR